MTVDPCSRREFLALSSAALGAGLTGPLAQTKASRHKSEKPNIIIFMPDQLRAESIACYGHSLVQTPNIDRLVGEGGYNTNEPHCFEPLEAFSPQHIYYPKIALENESPETITRTTTIRTRPFKLTVRPQGTSEMYNLQKDPREMHNVYGQAAYARQQKDLESRMLNWYVRTSDVVPYGRNDRSLPKYEGV